MAKTSGITFTVKGRGYNSISASEYKYEGVKTLEAVINTTSRVLVPLIISSAEISNRIIARAAAIFMQHLLTRTPIDEDYSYYVESDVKNLDINELLKKKEELLKRYHENKARLGNFSSFKLGSDSDYRELHKSINSIASRLEKIDDDIYDAKHGNRADKKKKIKFHKKDNSVLREDWYLNINYKKINIRDLYPSDDFSLNFTQLNEAEEVDTIFENILKIAFSDTKRIVKSFSATNINEHYEYVELGCAKYKNTGNKAEVNFPHGSKGNYSYYAPAGMYRITEAEIPEIFNEASKFVSSGFRNDVIKRNTKFYGMFPYTPAQLKQLEKYASRKSFSLKTNDIQKFLNEYRK